MKLEEFLTIVYVALTAAVLSTLLVPFLRELSTHGKTREKEPSSAAFWRPVARLTVPKRYFLHFYVLGLLSTLTTALLYGQDANNSVLLLRPTGAMLLVHLTRRMGECLFVHAWRSDSRMHAAGYLLGILHYALVSLTFIAVGEVQPPPSLGWKVAGVVVCLYGQAEQFVHHRILAGLRSRDGKTTYALPNGRWFVNISCPHYLAEITIYVGFLMLLQTTVATAMFVWVATNLTISALSSHQWYDQHFPDSNRSRRAIIPFLL